MSRKAAASLLLLAGAVFAGFVTLNHFLSIKTAYISIKRPGVGVTIYTKAGTQKANLAESGKVSLETGEYYLVPKGSNINTDNLNFKVTDRGAYVTVDPGYSDDYLGQLLDNQLPATTAALLAAYPQAGSGFSINKGRLYAYGDWYATTLVQAAPGAGVTGDVYRVVLQRQQNRWKVVTTPAIVLSALDYPDIPRSILQDINAQTGY